MHRLSFIYGVVVALHFHLRFENGVNFDGSQACASCAASGSLFENGVNFDGSQARYTPILDVFVFENGVNFDGSQA